MATQRDTDGFLRMGGRSLRELAEDPSIGTPTYVYDLDAIADEARMLRTAFEGAPHLIAYAVKANSAGPIVRTLVDAGCGADVVSGAELRVALGCGAPPDRVVYSGVAKTDAELDLAIGCGHEGVGAIQAESLEELVRIDTRAAALGRRANVSLRINPAVSVDDLATHHHIATGHDEAKFGIALEDVGIALGRLRETSSSLLVGISSHIGSQFTSVQPYVSAAKTLFTLAQSILALPGGALRFIDTGGGYGVDYGDGCSARPSDFVRAARNEQRTAGLDAIPLRIEPGRALVAAHGVLLTRVIQKKVGYLARGEEFARRWILIDAGMNDLLRPALYQARHRIVPLMYVATDEPLMRWRIAGPVCESSDDFGHHDLPADPGADFAILDAGAYGFTMASRYNGRALPAEVFLKDGAIHAVLAREDSDNWVQNRLGIVNTRR